MGHLSAKDSYHRLQQRLERMPVGAPGRETIRQILGLLFTPEEAELASRLPLRPTSLEKIARRLQTTVDKLRPLLETMAEKGLVLDVFAGGKMRYCLPPVIVGLFEFSMMRVRQDIDQKKLAGLLRRYILEEPDFASSFRPDLETSPFRTLPHPPALEDFAEVLDWEKAEQLVQEAGRWAVAICHCRHVEHHHDRDCRKFRMECCLSLGGGADYVIRHHLGRPLEKSQALELLLETREAGLVHIADNVRSRPTFICNCCGCCCEVLQGFKRLRLFQHTMTSNYVARPLAARCTGCKKCQQVCPIEAIGMEQSPHQIDGKTYRFLARVDESVCLGCGVCVMSCKYDSMKLRPRAQKRIPPENTFARVMAMALEQGKFHHLLAEAFDSWSGQLGAAVLGAIIKLPPASSLLARRELRSRFVEWMLRRTSSRRFPEKNI